MGSEMCIRDRNKGDGDLPIGSYSLSSAVPRPLIKVIANPQLENGYTSIANELMEAFIKTPLSGQEFRLLFFVIRKTYGFHKKEDYISLTQIAKGIGISKQRAHQIMSSLVRKKVITVKENINGKTKKYCFNKNYEEWRPSIKTVRVKVLRQKGYRKSDTTKYIITKEKYIYSEDSLEYKLASLLYRHILKRNPGHKAPNWGVWCKDMDKLLRIDKRPPAQVEKVINWCQKDSFWQDNILSPRKLRQQYDRLVLKMRKETVKYG